MEKVLGIVAEYNPLHNGHLYHLKQSLELTNAKYSVAILGGNFSQRGNVSIVDKWSKTQMTLCAGIDLVIELPILYSISSAENFADGAIKILDSMKIVDYLSFGTEATNIRLLDRIADVLVEEPKEYRNILSHELSKGLSFPKARENALMLYLNDVRKFAGILSSPNNILAIEYIKALKKYNSSITPLLIKRFGANHNDLTYSNQYASGTAIRQLLHDNNFKMLQNIIPYESYTIIDNEIKLGHYIPDLSFFEQAIIYKLRMMSIAEIQDLADVSEGLEFALKKAANSCNNLADFIKNIASKRYTNTRIQRILLYALLNITKKDIELSKKTFPYIRVLGFNKKGQYLLSNIINQNPKTPVITSVKQFIDSNTNRNLQYLINKDITATNIYTLGYMRDSVSNLDFTHKIVKYNR